MKKGFTLLELIIVIIVIGILATLGFTQYTRVVEQARMAEGKNLLGQLRLAQAAYNLEYSAFTSTIANLGVDTGAGLNTACATTGYFSYGCATTGTCTATRCDTATSKNPGWGTAYTVALTQAGAFTYTNAP